MAAALNPLCSTLTLVHWNYGNVVTVQKKQEAQSNYIFLVERFILFASRRDAEK